MSVKIHKAVLPHFIGSRQHHRRRTFVVPASVSGPIFAAVYSGSNKICLWDSSLLKLSTLAAGGPDEIHWLQSDASTGNLVVSQASGALTIFELTEKSPKRYINEHFNWFFSTKSGIYGMQDEKISTFAFDAQFSTQQFDLEKHGYMDNIRVLKKPTIFQVDKANHPTTHEFQVWQFSSTATPTEFGEVADPNYRVPKFKFEGNVDSKFGLALLRIHGDLAAAVTHSGTQLELWFLGSQERKGKSYQQVSLRNPATALFLDDEWLIVGHNDGNMTLFDRINGKKTVCEFSEDPVFAVDDESETSEELGASDCILWIDRVDEYVFYANNHGVEVMRADTKAKILAHNFPNRCKLEQAYLHKETKTVYAVISTLRDDDKSADIIVWKPNIKDLDRKAAIDRHKTYARISDGEIAIPREILIKKDMSLWSCSEVLSFAARTGLGPLRSLFWDAQVTGSQLCVMDESKLADIGVYEAPLRRQILLEISFVNRDQNGTGSPLSSRSASTSTDNDLEDSTVDTIPSTPREMTPRRTRRSSPRSNMESPPASPSSFDRFPKTKIIFTIEDSTDIVSIKLPAATCSYKQFRNKVTRALIEDDQMLYGGVFTVWKIEKDSRDAITDQRKLDAFLSSNLSRHQLAYLTVSIEKGRVVSTTQPSVSSGSPVEALTPSVDSLVRVRTSSPRTSFSL